MIKSKSNAYFSKYPPSLQGSASENSSHRFSLTNLNLERSLNEKNPEPTSELPRPLSPPRKPSPPKHTYQPGTIIHTSHNNSNPIFDIPLFK